MKKLLAVLLAVIIAECFGQGRPLLGGLRRPGQQSRDEKQFLEKHPTGTNEFNRTFPQQQDYEKGFDLKSFLGYEFGGTYANGQQVRSGAYRERLAKPFRMFSEVVLWHTELNRLYKVELRTNTVDIALESLSNEVVRIKALLSRTYQIELNTGVAFRRGCNNVSSNLEFNVDWSCDRTTGRGRISLIVTNHRVCNADRKTIDERMKHEVALKSKAINIGEEEGLELLLSPLIISQKKKNASAAETSFVDIANDWVNDYDGAWPTIPACLNPSGDEIWKARKDGEYKELSLILIEYDAGHLLWFVIKEYSSDGRLLRVRKVSDGGRVVYIGA